jgi:hypothetical protein
MTRLLILVVSVAGALYLTATALTKSASNSSQNKAIIEKPAEVKEQVNQSINKAEKLRQDALNESN